MLIDNYGQQKFTQGVSILEQFEKEGGDRYLETNERYLLDQLQKEVFLNN